MVDRRTQFSRLRSMLVETRAVMLTFSQLQELIMMNIGSAPRTVEMAMRTMGATGLIKDIGESKFAIPINGKL